jgi:XTP/dITP diphosphohydrolase
MQEIIVATGNLGKLREFSDMLADFSLRLTSLRDHFSVLPEIPETGATFEENSLIKAQWLHERKPGLVMADDSGLEVDYLKGAPGVMSARYSGPESTDESNLKKLLAELAGVPGERRMARFRCVITLITDTGETHVARGVCEGVIGLEPRGTNGFGYDPVFIPRGFRSSFAELDPRIKHAISHRGKALLNLRKELVSLYGRK